MIFSLRDGAESGPGRQPGQHLAVQQQQQVEIRARHRQLAQHGGGQPAESLAQGLGQRAVGAGQGQQHPLPQAARQA
ncbi:hypothetical protein HMPREF0731_4479, partial [Pseudoroseomonas cervicalis ATCC 49957]